jgi:hypothetical protein
MQLFQFDDGEYLFAINNAIVYGSRPYGKFQGGIFWRTPSPLVATLLPITLAANDKTAAAVENYDVCYLQGWVP